MGVVALDLHFRITSLAKEGRKASSPEHVRLPAAGHRGGWCVWCVVQATEAVGRRRAGLREMMEGGGSAGCRDCAGTGSVLDDTVDSRISHLGGSSLQAGYLAGHWLPVPPLPRKTSPTMSGPRPDCSEEHRAQAWAPSAPPRVALAVSEMRPALPAADFFAAAGLLSVVLAVKISGLSVLICKMGTVTSASEGFRLNRCFQNCTRVCLYQRWSSGPSPVRTLM